MAGESCHQSPRGGRRITEWEEPRQAWTVNGRSRLSQKAASAAVQARTSEEAGGPAIRCDHREAEPQVGSRIWWDCARL
eukprot:1597448-Alexandrium_andersonii.AAC.1